MNNKSDHATNGTQRSLPVHPCMFQAKKIENMTRKPYISA